MDPATDNFAGLRSLLKLKRYEQPPPRYFEDLSQGVIHRLRGPEGLRQQSLLASLGLRTEWKPAFFYALGVACCALSLYGVASLVVTGPTPDAGDPQTASVFSPNDLLSPSLAAPVLSREGPPEASTASTNPVLDPGTVSFPLDAFRLRPMPVRYDQK